MKPDTLVILSLPFQRLIRSHLSPVLLEILTKRADVVVVSPFAERPDFVDRYKGERITHLMARTPESLPSLSRKFVTISNTLRVRGYWCRNRKRLPYYWASRNIGFGENGNDTVVSLPKRMVMDILGWVGCWPRAWVFLDSLIGRASFDIPRVANLADSYDRVTLIQAASWGFQDKALAWMGRKYKWRTVFLPYTTDQLFCNGYLYSDFDAICVQGPAERQFAVVLHGLEVERIVNSGSLSFLSMRKALMSRPVECKSIDGKRRVLFAGSTATHYPSESEFDCLEHLLRAVEIGELKNTVITYRPVGHTSEIRGLIERRFAGRKCLDIAYPSPSIYWLNEHSPTKWEDILNEHLESIAGYDLAIMVGVTSLALDLTIYGTPSIAYFDDPSGTLQRRKTDFRFDGNGKIVGFEDIPTVLRKDHLVPAIKLLFYDSIERRRIAGDIAARWDYNPPNILELLDAAVFGH